MREMVQVSAMWRNECFPQMNTCTPTAHTCVHVAVLDAILQSAVTLADITQQALNAGPAPAAASGEAPGRKHQKQGPGIRAATASAGDTSNADKDQQAPGTQERQPSGSSPRRTRAATQEHRKQAEAAGDGTEAGAQATAATSQAEAQGTEQAGAGEDAVRAVLLLSHRGIRWCFRPLTRPHYARRLRQPEQELARTQQGRCLGPGWGIQVQRLQRMAELWSTSRALVQVWHGTKQRPHICLVCCPALWLALSVVYAALVT